MLRVVGLEGAPMAGESGRMRASATGEEQIWFYKLCHTPHTGFPMKIGPAISRREFLAASAVAALGAAVSGCATSPAIEGAEPVIDIHQHLGYSGRSDAEFLAHQQAMGADLTILLPAGTPTISASTHDGASNGLEAKCEGNEACFRRQRSAGPPGCRRGHHKVFAAGRHGHR
jgi:hypothetical protein